MSSNPPTDQPPPPPRKRLLGVSLGAGLVGAGVLALRWFIRPPTKSAIPEGISPPMFSTCAFQSACGQMIYHESGSGPAPTLVFVHGLEVGASSYEWAGVYAPFAAGRRVLAPDLIGFGESERPDRTFSAADMAGNLAEFIEGLCSEEAQRPIVVASGLGAGIAASMAAQNPELISRLVLWMPTGSAETSLRLNLGMRVPTFKRFLYRNHLARRATIRRRLAARAGIQPDETLDKAVEVYALCAQQYQADCVIYRLLQRRMDLDLPAALRTLSVPVTVLWPGAGDSAAGLEAARKMAAESRLGALRVVLGVNAGGLLLAPEAVVAALEVELQAELRVLPVAV